MRLNRYGAIAADCWHQIPQHFSHVGLSEFVVMPNHIHGIIVITRRDMALPCPPPDDRANSQKSSNSQKLSNSQRSSNSQESSECDRLVQTDGGEEDTAVPCPYERRFGDAISGSIPTIIGSFKSAVTKRINLVRNATGTPVWQQNYHEHIIRDERSRTNIQNYIVNNPRSWMNDRFR